MSSDAELLEEVLKFIEEDISSLTREELKNYLRVLGVNCDPKDSTSRLIRLLHSAMDSAKKQSGEGATLLTGASDPMLLVIQMLQQQMQQQQQQMLQQQQQMKQQEERFRSEQQTRDQQFESMLGRIGLLPRQQTGSQQGGQRQDPSTRITIQPQNILKMV